MELFTDDIPNGWITTTPDDISEITLQGRVHSGNSSVNLTDGADLSQTIPISEGCFYELSFFAHGEGAQVGLEATVTFLILTDTEVLGLQINVNPQDSSNSNRTFGFYRGITIQAPIGTVGAEIKFAVTAEGNQSLDLDDVSFTIQ